jgi:hypothetical protein
MRHMCWSAAGMLLPRMPVMVILTSLEFLPVSFKWVNQCMQQDDTEVVEVFDINWKEDSQGLPGQALSLHLLLRVVADIGIVGFPNAGRLRSRRCTRAQSSLRPHNTTQTVKDKPLASILTCCMCTHGCSCCRKVMHTLAGNAFPAKITLAQRMVPVVASAATY